MDYYHTLDTGDLRGRKYWIMSVGYGLCLINSKRIIISANSDVLYRNGWDEVFVYKPYKWESRYTSLELNDIGLSVGLDFQFNICGNIYLFHELSYVRYLYLYSEGVNLFGELKNPSRNTFAINFGIGLQF